MPGKFLTPLFFAVVFGAGVVLASCAPSTPPDGMSGSSARVHTGFNPTPSPSEVRGSVP